MDAGELLEVAVRAARAGAEVLLERFGGPAVGVESKSTATDLVSEADRAAEAAVLAVLTQARPGDGIVAEEGGSAESQTGLRWVVDPLDGTVNFLFGIPHWAVSVAVEDPSGPLAGVVLDAVRGETFTARRGAGARLNGTPIRVASRSDVSDALVATGFAYAPDVRVLQARIAADVIGRVRDLRRAGTASLDLAWTAAGRLDGYYESGLKPWDLAAGGLLVTEAGGLLGHLPRPVEGDPGVVAAAPAVYEGLLAILDEAIAVRG